MESAGHRKRVRHYDGLGHLHELTFSCYRRMPLLTNDPWRRLLSQSIDAAVSRHAFSLVAFVSMPEHVHLLVSPQSSTARVSHLLKAIKQPFSHRVKRLLREAKSPLLDRLTVRERPGKTAFRFWQEGGGYDRNLTESRTVRSAIDYIHLNPVGRGLVDSALAWRWSSARHYDSDERIADDALPVVHGLSRGNAHTVTTFSPQHEALAGKPDSAFLKDPAGSVLVAVLFPQPLDFTRDMFMRASRV